jgi:predicted ATPase
LDVRNGAATTKICRWPDGNPLAVELAAATATAPWMEWLAARADDQLSLLTRWSSNRATAAAYAARDARLELRPVVGT